MWWAFGIAFVLSLLIVAWAIWTGKPDPHEPQEQVPMTKEDAKYLAWWLKERAD